MSALLAYATNCNCVLIMRLYLFSCGPAHLFGLVFPLCDTLVRSSLAAHLFLAEIGFFFFSEQLFFNENLVHII